ncbi:MAG: BCCT family transporter [Myxococcota bacterium]|nr:BCCT family transporter [Myxococcota bacterium]
MKPTDRVQVDGLIFGLGSLLLLAVILPIVVAPNETTALIEELFQFLTEELGILYVLLAIFVTGFLLYIALSPHGAIRLGETTPAHSNFSWAAMLFCAGIGASLLYWGAAEWVFYYTEPPFGLEARSPEAVGWAASYGLFHWGPVGWAFYCLPTVALGLSYHRARIPVLRLSAACAPLLGGRIDHLPARLIDLLFIVGLLGTAATGLGLGTSVVASAVNRLAGIEDGFALQACVIAVATFLIAVSVYRGLDQGIKVLSNVNAILALGFIVYVALVGPTAFILEMGVTSIGKVVQNFPRMISWTDPLSSASFVESWTVFYWAWWLALGPFIGMFVCKISEGRTLRSVIFGMLGWGSLGCALFFIVLGNYALFLELEGLYPVVEEATTIGPSTALAGIVERLPLGRFWLAYLAAIGLIFIATTYDSASYTLAAGATRSLREDQHPARWHRVFWAISLGLLPLSLLFLGGLKVLQTASIVASVPLLGVYVMLMLAILRMVRAPSPSEEPTPPAS